MRNAIIGFVLGVMFIALLAVIFGPGAERRLIDDWRKIELGMTINDVKSKLGEPGGQFPIGQGFPEWAEQSVPNDYFESHGLLTYVIPLIGPQVLLIYYDSDDRVVFVSSVPT